MTSINETKAEIYQDEADLPIGWFLHRFGLGDPVLIPILGNFVLGRNQLKSSSISKAHARFSLLDDQKVLVQDLGSRNGTYVNRNKVTRNGIILQDCDCISLGAPLPKTENSYGFILRKKPDCVSHNDETPPRVMIEKVHTEEVCQPVILNRQCEANLNLLKHLNQEVSGNDDQSLSDVPNPSDLHVIELAELQPVSKDNSSNTGYDSDGGSKIHPKCEKTRTKKLERHPVIHELGANSALGNATDSSVIVISTGESSDSDRTVIFESSIKRKVKLVPKRRSITKETNSDATSEDLPKGSLTKNYSKALVPKTIKRLSIVKRETKVLQKKRKRDDFVGNCITLSDSAEETIFDEPAKRLQISNPMSPTHVPKNPATVVQAPGNVVDTTELVFGEDMQSPRNLETPREEKNVSWKLNCKIPHCETKSLARNGITVSKSNFVSSSSNKHHTKRHADLTKSVTRIRENDTENEKLPETSARSRSRSRSRSKSAKTLHNLKPNVHAELRLKWRLDPRMSNDVTWNSGSNCLPKFDHQFSEKLSF